MSIKQKPELLSPYLLLPLAASALILYTLVSGSFPFRDQLFSVLYPKQPSLAAPVK